MNERHPKINTGPDPVSADPGTDPRSGPVTYSGPDPGSGPDTSEIGAGTGTRGGGKSPQTRRSKKSAPRAAAAGSGQKTSAARPAPRGPSVNPRSGTKAATSERSNAPLDLNLPGKLVAKTPNIVDVLTGVLRIVADINVTTKPELPQGPGITFGPDALKRLWDIPDAELKAIATPLAEMFPALPPAMQKKLNSLSNPLALVGNLWVTIAPRVEMEKQIVAELRRYNAGYAAPPGNSGSANSTGSAAHSANDNAVPPPVPSAVFDNLETPGSGNTEFDV